MMTMKMDVYIVVDRVMEIVLTSIIELNDDTWGFSDLINGRVISEDVIDEIKDLILEDSSELNNPDNWKIEIK